MENGTHSSAFNLLNGARYAVLGAGVSGRAAARLLLSEGKQVTLLDDNERSTEADVISLMQQGVVMRWGRPSSEEAAAIMSDADALIVSPGVPAEHPLRIAARELGRPAAGEIELAWLRSAGAKTVAITGTNGKTTVTMLIRHIAQQAGMHAVETGNIGYAFADAVRENAHRLNETVFSVEVSSFQLEDTIGFAPDVAVILNITPDHLDRHHAMDEYAAAKARITANQGASQVLVVNQDDKYCLEIAHKTRARVMYFSTERAVTDGAWLDADQLVAASSEGKSHRLLDLEKLPLFGMHNVSNALAASCAAAALGIGRKTITAGLESFQGAPHRLQHVATIGGVEYFNDSKATNIDAMVKAVASFSAPIHLIAGGRDKDSPFETVRSALAGRVVRAYLIGEAAEKIERAWSPEIACMQCDTMPRALEAASEAASNGEIVLLAPGCASFDQFQNYADRGRKFIQWVKERESLSSSTA